MADLRTEVWIAQLTKNFYPDSSFLKYTKDFSPLVDNHAINMVDVGIDPEVLIDNDVYPIGVTQREDTPIRIELRKFETENTLVRSPEVIEYSYDKLENVIMGHRNILRASTAEVAAYSYAPTNDSTFTPVIKTTGNTVNGRKRLSVEDILALKERYDTVDIPLEDRFLVLHPSHLSDLILFDVKAFKDIADIRNGLPQRFAGFNILQFSKPANYAYETMTKKSFGAMAVAGDTFCSFAFHREEVMRADGQVKMYQDRDNPKERATIVGFEKRFVAVPIRNKGLGAIVSALV